MRALPAETWESAMQEGIKAREEIECRHGVEAMRRRQSCTVAAMHRDIVDRHARERDQFSVSEGAASPVEVER